MIAKLSGILDLIGDTFLIIDVQGVGYQVFASRRTLSTIGDTGDAVSVLIQTQVREDAITLFGFLDAAEQEWFKLLTSVQGVGAKAGMAILSICPPDQLGFAIAAGDANVVRQADGVGPKLATRIITELKDKAGKVDLAPKLTGVKVESAAVVTTEQPQAKTDIGQDAVSALVNLGYGRSDAFAAVMQAQQKANDNADLQSLITLALKELSS